MIPAHIATFCRSVVRLVVIYGACVIAGHLIYHGGEVLRLKEHRGRNAELPAELASDLRRLGLSEKQVDQFAHSINMKRSRQ